MVKIDYLTVSPAEYLALKVQLERSPIEELAVLAWDTYQMTRHLTAKANALDSRVAFDNVLVNGKDTPDSWQSSGC